MAPGRDPTDGGSDEPPDGPSDRSSGLLAQLRAIVETLAEIEANEGGLRRESGHIDRGRTRIDYDYEVSIGLGDDTHTASSRDRPVSEGARTGPTGSQQGDGEAIHIATRAVDDDESVVIADLPGVADAELEVVLDTDGPALELWADEELVGRVGLDRPDVTITDVTLNNQILEIRLSRANQPTEGTSE